MNQEQINLALQIALNAIKKGGETTDNATWGLLVSDQDLQNLAREITSHLKSKNNDVRPLEERTLEELFVNFRYLVESSNGDYVWCQDGTIHRTIELMEKKIIALENKIEQTRAIALALAESGHA
jgi:hypothetical protein